MTFCQLPFSKGILYSSRAAGSCETHIGVSNGRNNFYSAGPQPVEERICSSFRFGLFLAQTPLMIQNINKTWDLEHGAIGNRNFINAWVIDTLTAVKHAANIAQVLQIILWFFQRYFLILPGIPAEVNMKFQEKTSEVRLLSCLLTHVCFLFLFRQVRHNMHSLLLSSFKSLSSLDSSTALFQYLLWEKPCCTFSPKQVGLVPGFKKLAFLKCS